MVRLSKNIDDKIISPPPPLQANGNEVDPGEFCEIFLAQLYPIIWISL